MWIRVGGPLVGHKNGLKTAQAFCKIKHGPLFTLDGRAARYWAVVINPHANQKAGEVSGGPDDALDLDTVHLGQLLHLAVHNI